jgi:diguanylate cyclase (GGDEF)-like protein/PAS domain S-box-containing protein
MDSGTMAALENRPVTRAVTALTCWAKLTLDGVIIAGALLTAGWSVAFALPSARAGYSSGKLLDAAWFPGYLLFAAAAWITGLTFSGARGGTRHWTRVSVGAGARRSLELSGLLLPYAAGAICLGGIVADGLTGDHRIHPALLGTGATVLVALVVRQGVALLDNNALTRELAVREDHFRSLVQGSSDVIMTVDPAGRLGYISPAVSHVFGYEAEVLIGTSLYQLVHVDDQISVEHAVDRFLTGDVVWAGVECRIRAALPSRHDGGSTRWQHAECTLTRHRGGLVFTCRDVSDRIALQQQLAHNAYHDSLTGLPNRALFVERLEQAVVQRSAAVHPTAVLFLDLDWFKAVNDAAGHAAGDALLVEVAERLRQTVRAGGTVARFGGDEFAVLVEGGPEGRTACQVAARLHEVLTRPYRLPAGRFVIGASIGVAFWRPEVTAAELMREADTAMYEAKAGGKGLVVVREPAVGHRAEQIRGSG